MKFIFERLYKFYNVNPSVIRAVLATGESNLLEIDKKIKLLNKVVESEDFKELQTTFKRVANIVKDFDLNSISVDENLFEKEEEKDILEKGELMSMTDSEEEKEEKIQLQSDSVTNIPAPKLDD